MHISVTALCLFASALGEASCTNDLKRACIVKGDIEDEDELSMMQTAIRVHQTMPDHHSDHQDDAVQKQNNAKIREYIRPDVTCIPWNLEEEHYPVNADVDFSGTGLRLQIPRVKAEGLTPGSFHQRFVKPNMPVVIVDGVEAIWNSKLSWTKAALLKNKKAQEKFPVTRKRPRLVAAPEACISVPELFNSMNRTVLFDATAFKDLSPDQPDQNYLPNDGKMEPACYHHHFNHALHKELFSKLKNKSFLLQGEDQKPKSLPTYKKRSTFNLHLSVKGGALPHSHKTTLNFLFSGAKRWIMVDPRQYDTEQEREWFEEVLEFNQQTHHEMNYSSWDWFKYKSRQHIKKSQVKYYDFVLQEGEAIFIPSYYTHATLDLCRETIGAELMGDIIDWGYQPDWIENLHHPFG